MKKFYSIVLAALAVCAVSCQEGPLDKPEAEAPQTGETMTFTASFGDTKVTLGDDGVTPLWENNDAITIYGKDGAKAVYRTTLPEGEKASTATFQYDRGLNNNQDCPTLTPPYYAVYGHQDYRSKIVDNVVDYVMIYKDQTVGDHYVAPMIAYSDNTILSFKNAAALLKFTVNADNVQSVKIVADANIAGDTSCDKDAKLSFLKDHFASKDVTLRGEFVKGETYHIAIAPTSVSSLKMYVNGDESKNVAKVLKFERSNIYDLGTIEQFDVKHVNCNVYLAHKDYQNLWGWADGKGNWFTETYPGIKTEHVVNIDNVEYKHWNFDLDSKFFVGKSKIRFTQINSSYPTSDLEIEMKQNVYVKAFWNGTQNIIEEFIPQN